MIAVKPSFGRPLSVSGGGGSIPRYLLIKVGHQTLRIRLGLQEIDTTSKDVGAELKMYERTLLTTGIIIISTPASAIVLRIASINLFPKFAH